MQCVRDDPCVYIHREAAPLNGAHRVSAGRVAGDTSCCPASHGGVNWSADYHARSLRVALDAVASAALEVAVVADCPSAARPPGLTGNAPELTRIEAPSAARGAHTHPDEAFVVFFRIQHGLELTRGICP